MFGLGTTEIIFILIIFVVLFGGPKLPQIGRGLGEMIRNFKNAISGDPDKDLASKKDEEKKESGETKK
jgi:sec-independent protein translocase protein TatA